MRSWILAAMIVAIPTQASAQPETQPCLPAAEVQNLAAFALPTALQIVDDMCAKSLAPEAGFSQTAQALKKQYQSAADAAWPAARGTLRQLLNRSQEKDPTKQVFAAMLAADDPTALRSFVVTTVESKAGKPIGPRACAAIKRVLGLVAPLPLQNMAGLFELVIELIANDRKDASSPLHLMVCPAPPIGQ